MVKTVRTANNADVVYFSAHYPCHSSNLLQTGGSEFDSVLVLFFLFGKFSRFEEMDYVPWPSWGQGLGTED